MGPAMQQITDWLEKLGMPEYAERFAENDIDCSVLRYLTDQDLKELGVSLGHRRKMLESIAQNSEAAPITPDQSAGVEPEEFRRAPTSDRPILRLGRLHGTGRHHRP